MRSLKKYTVFNRQNEKIYEQILSEEEFETWILAHQANQTFGKNSQPESVDLETGEIIPAIECEYRIESSEFVDRLDQIRQAQSFLAGTDWYITRKIETGKEVPAEILKAREEAREKAGL